MTTKTQEMITITKKEYILPRDLLSLTMGAGGFLVAQLVLIGRVPSHWLFILLMAASASC